MKTFLFSLTFLAFAAAVTAAEPTPVRVAVALALSAARPPQAPVAPQAPAVADLCNCQDTGDCVCSPGKCACSYCTSHPSLRPIATSPTYSIAVLSRTKCPPCASLAAELRANGGDIEWDIWTGRADVEAKYAGVTAYPTILLLRDGREVSRHVGYMSAVGVKRWMVKRWMADTTGPQSRGQIGSKWSVEYGYTPTGEARGWFRQVPAYCPPGGS
jgi:hypothetical protein